jgi:hypothetical protein
MVCCVARPDADSPTQGAQYSRADARGLKRTRFAEP